MKKKNNGITFLILLLISLAIVAGTLLALKFVDNKQTAQTEGNVVGELEPEPEPTVQTFTGNERAIALMIDNATGAWPQGGLNDADLVYEIIVEGGESRLMAVFKGKKLDHIGPVRSARHYFIDYALENDAIYTHFGWSPQAESDISTYNVDNINGITVGAPCFVRTSDKYSPHNVATNTEEIMEVATKKGYRTTSDSTSVLKYNAYEFDLEDGKPVSKITIPYSTSQVVTYEYEEDTKKFVRYARGKLQTDWNTDAAVKTKNIIVTFAANYTLTDSENKGRQGIRNIGILKGYYLTNGKYIEITCEKESRTSKTIYKDLSGKEIEVNDGNTFIQICPLNAKVTFVEPVVETPVANTIDNTNI